VDAVSRELVEAGHVDRRDSQAGLASAFDEIEDAVVPCVAKVHERLRRAGFERHGAGVDAESEVVGGGVGLGAKSGHGES
jgi:hypothetical protein